MMSLLGWPYRNLSVTVEPRTPSLALEFAAGVTGSAPGESRLVVGRQLADETLGTGLMAIQGSSTGVYRLAADRLSAVDSDQARLIKVVGPCMHQPKPAREPYEALVRAVAYQQLHARAGDAIISRLLDLYPKNRFPSPKRILDTRFESLKACGFSARKIETIRGIAEGAVSGLVPERAVADGMSDEELIARLASLHGIGRWSVEMLLIYTLARVDILPA